MKQPKWKMLLLCFVCTFLWGAGYSVLKISYTHWNIASDDVVSKLLFAGVRFLISGAILLLLASVRKKRFVHPDQSCVKRIALFGLLQTTLQYGLLYIGLANTSAAKGSILNQCSVFLVVILAPLFYKNEKITSRKLLGCIIGFAGIITMNLHGLTFSLDFGDAIVIASSCCAALGYLVTKSFPPASDAIMNTAYQQLLGGTILLAIGAIGGGRLTVVTLPGLSTLAFLVVISAAAYGIWFYLLQHNEVSRISVYKFLTPFFGVIISGILLGEEIFTTGNIAALILVCIGVIVVNGEGAGRIIKSK